jgi:putative nucleotidyltransferase with HDIG domain
VVHSRIHPDCRLNQDGENAVTSATGTAKAIESAEIRWDANSVPPFPAIALKALKLMSGTDTSLLELCNLIRSDPAFSAAVLKIANSPLVAFSKNITSVLQASMLLGFQRLRSVVITVGLKTYLKDSFTQITRACWQHSVACAIIAERSANWSRLDKEFAYTAGILHDIGRIALATIMPGPYTRVVERGADQPQDLLSIERELCGIDHCQAGRSLATAWNLPEAFHAVIACHHDAETRFAGAASLILPSCTLADILGFAVIHYRSLRTYADTLEMFPEPARKQFPASAKELAARIAAEIKVIESA